MTVKTIPIGYTYKKSSGAWVLDTQAVVPDSAFEVVSQAIVWLPARQVAGNHRHGRNEAILGIGEHLYLWYQDDSGEIRREEMQPDGQLLLFIIPGGVAHGVVNQSEGPVVLYEYFDSADSTAERVMVVPDSEVRE